MLRVASLFAGCGGMDLGVIGDFRFLNDYFHRFPTTIVHSSDFDPRIVEIFNDNFKHKATVRDIRTLASNEIPAFDVLLGGFPCQSFSIVAQNPPRLGYKDLMGQLFFEMKRILQERQPRVFVAENVKGLLSANDGNAFPLILEEFRSAGYHVRYKVLNASHYGVPQKRERVFIVGFRSSAAAKRFEFPIPLTQDAPIPLQAVLEPSGSIDEKFFFSARAVRGMRQSKNSKLMNKGRAQDPDLPCNTVGAHLAKVSLNSTDPVLKVGSRYRMFTPREVARIQSFPESFTLSGSRTANYVALGNAVPPVLMWHVFKQTILALGFESNTNDEIL